AGAQPAYAFEPLPPGALLPSLTEPNLRNPEAVAAALRTVLGALTLRRRSMTLVLPDTVVRVFVLDFDAFPVKPAEGLPVLRFRLRKMVPFDVEHAGVSYQVLSDQKNACKVLAATMPGAILAEYEAAARHAGFEPGAVLPASLAALAAVKSSEPILAANLSAQALTTAITSGDDLLLYRTLDLPEGEGERLAEVQRGIAVAAAYFEDALGERPTRIHYAGLGSGTGSAAREFAEWLNDPEYTVEDLSPRPETGAATPLGPLNPAAVTGALSGAA
ncbi:MAG: hypothetical protein WCE75_14985, partial [Terracidiphilus sp.]